MMSEERKQLTIYLSLSLMKKLDVLADDAKRSVNKQIEFLLEKAIGGEYDK